MGLGIIGRDSQEKVGEGSYVLRLAGLDAEEVTPSYQVLQFSYYWGLPSL